MRSSLAGSPARRRARSSVPHVEGLEDRRLLATFTVTNPADSGTGSLRSAITQANLDPDPDTIDFAPSITGTITLTSALPNLTSDLILSGPGASALTVARSAASGTPDFRIFTVASGVTMEITDLTISGGQTFATGGGGIANAGRLTVTNSTISGNGAGAGGGGGVDNSGTLTVTNSTISGNSASNSGSGFEGNGGGGILNFGSLTVINSTLSGNSAAIAGGINNLGTMTITSSTISGNSANVDGGIRNSGEASRLTITASLFANGSGGNLVNFGGVVASLGHNLFTDRPGVSLDPTDLVNTDPLLGPLADNGGPTFTQALLPGSPAINAGVPIQGVTTDQRGIPRPQGTAPDIGAFELVNPPPLTANLAVGLIGRPDPVVLGQELTYTITVANLGRSPATGVVLTDVLPAGVVFLAATGGATPTDGRLTINLGTLASGETRMVAVVVRPLAAGTLVNMVSVRANEADPVPADNAATLATVVNAPPLTVVSFARLGFHRRPTRLVLAFSGPLDPARAQTRTNYTLLAPGRDHRFGTRDDRAIRIRSAAYDPEARAVTLRPRRLLDRHRRFVLIARADGLTSPAGVPLDGDADGQPGGDFVVRFGPGAAPRFTNPFRTRLGNRHGGHLLTNLAREGNRPHR